ncbi:hypothetical protein AK95_20200 [Paenibacillus sp. LC231]|nr:hypothetical protein AK95_20200 [Paenibacillus sp. LC231]
MNIQISRNLMATEIGRIIRLRSDDQLAGKAGLWKRSLTSTEKAELFCRSEAFSFAFGFQQMNIQISRNLMATEIGRIIRMRSDNQLTGKLV